MIITRPSLGVGRYFKYFYLPVEKASFTELTRNYTSLTIEETNEVIKLSKAFPYSQVIRSISARAAQENDIEGRNELLQLAAVHATDRGILKSIMTSPTRVITPVQGETEKAESVELPKTRPVTNLSEIDSLLSGDALLKEIMDDLGKLKKSKHEFEDALIEYEKDHSAMPKSGKTTKARTEVAPDGLIEEIKTSRKKIKTPINEQDQLIDQFIKTQPKMKEVAKDDSPADLAEGSVIQSGNTVSETLVEILLKQGKKEKAIEVLRKLIWKFPQKKAYFAAQIEDLKK